MEIKKILFAALLVIAPLQTQAADKFLVNRDKDGLALQGYDPVAYFTDSKAVEGSPMLTFRHQDATYRFASAEHQALFAADPAKYAPQFGGYCGYAASIDKLSPIDPKFFQVLDGRLVLQHNQKAWDLWNKDLAGNLVKADANWPGLVERNGTTMKQLANLDRDGLALQGYDPVAYVSEQKPVKGLAAITAIYNGATYRFASKDNKDTFERSPARYEPAFGGYCGYGVSVNKLAPIDPTAFQLIGGRLILQYDHDTLNHFNKDQKGNLAKAEKNWPGLVDKNGK